ncbi:MAG TPA: tetratricopeptide repeat protein, partial [Nannocystaceae bacterium]|nr:tetratricopeptide repeat protein [Nannocystaceae bacterium]
LDRLARRPIGRRQVAALAGAAALAGTIGVLAASATESSTPSDPCPRADERLAGIWDANRRDELRTGFAATGAPYAAATADTVVARLDEYAARWLDGQQAACRATRVEGTQSEALLDARTACFERRRSEIAVRVDALVGTDVALLERAIEYVTKLVPLDVCDDPERLASIDLQPEDPATRTEVDALLDELDRVDAQLAAGKADDALVERVRTLVVRADATEHHPTRAEALYRLARTFDHLSRFALARPEYERALAAAATGHHDRLAAVIWCDLVFLVGTQLEQPDEGVTLAQSAELAVVRDGDRPDQRAILATNLGSVMRMKGEWARAIGLHSQAVEIRRRLYGPEDLLVASSLNNLGNAHNANGEFERGLELLEQALAIRRVAYGDAHPRIAEALNNIGASLHGMGRYTEARARFEEALAIRQKLWGDEHPLVASTMSNLGSTLADLELYREAEPVQRRAIALLEKLHGADSPKLAMPLNNLANTLERRNAFAEALALHERSLALREAHDGKDSTSVALSLTNLGVLLDNMGRPDDARPRFERALAIYDRAAPDHPEAVNALVRLGQLEVTAGRALRGAELAARAVAICEESKFTPLRKAEADYVLAQARWETGDHRSAVGHAERALAFLRESGLRTDLATAIEEWLAIHVP